MILYDNISDAQITTDATRRTADGYLAASARVARTGIQVYTGRECGRPDLEFVRVYRPESEVFKQDAIKTFAHRPITDDHPHIQVTADNWKSLSKGHTGEEIVRDGRFIRVPMLLMDGPTIKKWEDGKRELSMGYSCDLEWKDGITDDGEEYDAIQTNIKANHLALVKKARGGEDLHIGDADDAGWDPSKHPRHPAGSSSGGEFASGEKVTYQKNRNERGSAKVSRKSTAKKKPHYYIETETEGTILVPEEELRKDSADNVHAADDLDNVDNNTGEVTMRIMVDGISLEIADKDAQIIQRALDAKDELFKKKKAEMEEMMTEEEKKKKKYETDAAALTTQVATLTTENTQLKQQVKDAEITPAKLEVIAAERTAVLDKASVILGKDKVVKTDSSAAIRRACVNHVVGDAAKDWSDDLVNASFATIKVGPSDGVRKLANSFDHQPQPQNATVLDAAYSKYEESLRKASQAAAA